MEGTPHRRCRPSIRKCGPASPDDDECALEASAKHPIASPSHSLPDFPLLVRDFSAAAAALSPARMGGGRKRWQGGEGIKDFG